MRELDKNKVYDLSDLTSEELKEIAKETDYIKGWNEFVKDSKVRLLYFEHQDNNWVLNYSGIDFEYTTTNAKELFYTLENIQVDCRDLSEEQIKKMADVFEKAGYKPFHKEEKVNLEVKSEYLFLNMNRNKFIVCREHEYKKTITYEKFMELFSDHNPDVSKMVSEQPKTEQIVKKVKFSEFPKSPRPVEKSILQEAEEIINGSRAEDYGSATENFTKIAVGWKEIFADGNFTPRRVALAMIWLKICRDVNTPKHDNILDIAGYAGCIGKMDNEAN